MNFQKDALVALAGILHRIRMGAYTQLSLAVYRILIQKLGDALQFRRSLSKNADYVCGRSLRGTGSLC